MVDTSERLWVNLIKPWKFQRKYLVQIIKNNVHDASITKSRHKLSLNAICYMFSIKNNRYPHFKHTSLLTLRLRLEDNYLYTQLCTASQIYATFLSLNCLPFTNWASWVGPTSYPEHYYSEVNLYLPTSRTWTYLWAIKSYGLSELQTPTFWSLCTVPHKVLQILNSDISVQVAVRVAQWILSVASSPGFWENPGGPNVLKSNQPLISTRGSCCWDLRAQ